MRRVAKGSIVAVMALLGLAGTAPADSLYTGPGPRPGPDILYAPVADAPQLQTTGIWEADPILVSGASAYRDGEFLYQDWIYDDHGARGLRDPNDPRQGDDSFSQPGGTYTYPREGTDDAAVYAENGADLVELRVRPLADATAFRLTYNTLIDPDVVGTTIAIGDGTANAPFPHSAGGTTDASMFLTVHGDEADLQTAAGAPVAGGTPTATVDLERRQVEVRVPHGAWDPGTTEVRLGAATGIWDPDLDVYVRPVPGPATADTPGGGSPSLASSAFFNVAFRFEARDTTAAAGEEPQPEIANPAEPFAAPRWWRDRAQADALTSGDLSDFFATVDFGVLEGQTEGDREDREDQPKGVPVTGAFNRILASHFEPSQGVDFDQECGNAEECQGQLRGQLQPYAIYVPSRPTPADGFGLTLLLHSLGANYNQFTASNNQEQFGERGRGTIVITPAGRGPDGWYYDLAGADTFEVWADVADKYELDPDHVSIAGYSMGGYGTYKLGTQFPDLFARAQPTVGPPTLGVSVSGEDSTGGPETSTRPQLPSLRWVPLEMWVGREDQLVPITSTESHTLRAQEVGLRYGFQVHEVADHFALAVHDQFGPAADFLDDAEVEYDRNPPRVTFVRNPTMDFPEVGTVADHAYWLSDVRVRNSTEAQPRGTIDVRSDGFGVGDPPVEQQLPSGGLLAPGTFGAIPFTRRGQTWGPAPATPVRDRLRIDAQNISRVVVDPARAQVTCAAELDVTSDGPIEVVLAGCGRQGEFGAERRDDGDDDDDDDGSEAPAGAGPPPAAAPPASPGRPAGTSASRCASADLFTRVAAVPVRGGKLRLSAALRDPRGRFAVSMFRQSKGRDVLDNRLVGAFTRRRSAVTWTPVGRERDGGLFLVRFVARTRDGKADVRRMVVQRRGDGFAVRPLSERRVSCGLLRVFKLERAAFGGSDGASLGIAVRTTVASRVQVVVRRGGRVVRRFGARTTAANRTSRLRLPAGDLARGDHRVSVLVTPVAGGAPVSATLTAKRL